jgi:hypothetical protein
MTRSLRAVTLIAVSILALDLWGCASTKQWSLSGGDRKSGVVRVSYEYPEFKQPSLNDAQALELAARRCNGWGYQDAEPIGGQIRQCSNKDDGNCDLWTVTRQYQCRTDTSYAAQLSK